MLAAINAEWNMIGGVYIRRAPWTTVHVSPEDHGKWRLRVYSVVSHALFANIALGTFSSQPEMLRTVEYLHAVYETALAQEHGQQEQTEGS